MTRENLRRWLDNQRAADERVRGELSRGAISGSESIDRAFDLISFARDCLGLPPPLDQPSEEEVHGYDQWVLLRRRLART